MVFISWDAHTLENVLAYPRFFIFEFLLLKISNLSTSLNNAAKLSFSYSLPAVASSFSFSSSYIKEAHSLAR